MTPRLQLLLNSLTAQSFPEFAAEYVKTQCTHRVKLRVPDAITHVEKVVYVPCGHCAACRSRRIADWCSRMAIHTQYCRKYVYFITLTYSSFREKRIIPKCLLDAYWRKDNLNKTQHFSYSPCLLRHEHFQRYMHYLRRAISPNTCDFFMCGEYGSTFGRPHFHALIWSDVPIDDSTFRRCWSVNLSKSRKFPKLAPIGNVRVDDLQANGTLNHGNGRNAFKYVAKYCSKSFLERDSMKKTRFRLFVSDLRLGLISDDDLRAIFSARVRQTKSILHEYAEFLSPHMREVEKKQYIEVERQSAYITDLSLMNKTIKSLQLNNPCNENEKASDDSYLLADWSSYFTPERLYEILHDFYRHCDTCVLSSYFAPYCLSSKSNAIGKQYALANLERFALHEQRLPESCGQTAIFSRYFDKLTARFVQRYFRLLPSLSTACAKIVPLADEVTCSRALVDVLSESPDLPESPHVFAPFGFGSSSISADEYVRRLDHCILDSHDRSRCIFVLTPYDGLTLAHYFYNRQTRTYEYQYSESVDAFYQTLVECCRSYLSYRQRSIDALSAATANYEYILKTMQDCCADYLEYISDAETYRDAMYTILCDKNNLLHNTNPLNE